MKTSTYLPLIKRVWGLFGLEICSSPDTGFESFQNEIINIGLKKLGYKMKTKQGGFSRDNYTAIANGNFDYTTTYPTYPWYKQTFEEANSQEKLEIVGTLIPNFIRGYQINKKTADRYKINNFQQLQDEKIAKLFDSDRNDKANIAHCNAPCEYITEQLKAYGLESTVEYDTNRLGMCNMRLFVESRPCYEKTITRYQEGKPILYYASQPEWIFSALKQGQDVVWLEVPSLLVRIPSLGACSVSELSSSRGRTACVLRTPRDLTACVCRTPRGRTTSLLPSA
ncbi:glycine betaine ABC transporter substrate-binding protein [Dapis sp. BLCC M229]|uniref:glycine betaine ABC transporter substrate-binding protein n=1 Tax=Dapis sp. BLCC M229 TaxID=3400188 RepID=UPI003CFAE428